MPLNIIDRLVKSFKNICLLRQNTT